MYCAEDYLLIPGGQDSMEQSLVTHSHDRYCGGFLSSENEGTGGSSVYSRVEGSMFWVSLVTGRRGVPGEETMTEFDQTLHGPGVRVRYSQHLHCLQTDTLN